MSTASRVSGSTLGRGPSIWLRLVTLSHVHAAIWALLSIGALLGYATSLEASARAAEYKAATELASTVLSRAESDFKNITALLQRIRDLPDEACSPSQLDALRRFDFEVDEVKEFGIFDSQGLLKCTSHAGQFPQPYDVALPDAKYGETVVSAALMPLLSEKNRVYVIRLGVANALLDGHRWFASIDEKEFGTRVEDQQSGKEIAQSTPGNKFTSPYAAQSLHFIVKISPTGLYAQKWLDARKARVMPLLGLMALVAAFVFWLILVQARSPLMRLKKLVWFRPKNVGLVYQPIVGIDRAQVVGAEALLRLQDRKGAVIPAVAVFSTLENEPALCQRLTALILTQGLRELESWLAEDRSRFLAVNVTQHDWESPALPGLVRALLAKHSVLPAQLHLELLETSQLGNDKTLRGLQALRDIGCELWIDDFGVGYSNLARLHTLPVHGVKLDREWVDSLDDTQHTRTDAVMHLVLFAGSNGLGVVAEGVSEESAMRTLLRLGVQKMQGFLFAPGLSQKELLQLSAAAVSVDSPRLVPPKPDPLRP